MLLQLLALLLRAALPIFETGRSNLDIMVIEHFHCGLIFWLLLLVVSVCKQLDLVDGRITQLLNNPVLVQLRARSPAIDYESRCLGELSASAEWVHYWRKILEGGRLDCNLSQITGKLPFLLHTVGARLQTFLILRTVDLQRLVLKVLIGEELAALSSGRLVWYHAALGLAVRFGLVIYNSCNSICRSHH